MSNNLTPWIVLSLIVLVSLAWKGYIKLPALPSAQPPAPPVAVQLTDPNAACVPHYPNPSTMTSHELAVLMASAARREAEQEVAGQIAREAADTLKAKFAAPFAAPPAAGEPAPAPEVKPGS